MYFLLKSEIELFDSKRNILSKRIYCPFCKEMQFKRTKPPQTNLFTEYQCYNKKCSKKGELFIIINEYIQDGQLFNKECESCGKPYDRDFKQDKNSDFLLIFKCNGKMCATHLDPYIYNLSKDKWESREPKIVIHEEIIDSKKYKLQQDKLKVKSNKIKIQKVGKIKKEQYTKAVKIDAKPKALVKNKNDIETKKIFCNLGEMPLLTMDRENYNTFLSHHNNKPVVLVDVPNFIRTLRKIYPFNFDKILKKAHELLIQFIEEVFIPTKGYIIRYFSKPDEDLDISNQILAEFCSKNFNSEYFHLLKIPKGLNLSDIDNYLIANAVEILERCQIKGFTIVSSDKDYLPVMKIASHKNIKSYILGVNQSEIYQKYGIKDIRFRGILRYLK